MNKRFADFEAEDRRLSLLILLAQSDGYSANAWLLQTALARTFGHNASADRMETDLAWLAEQALITVERPGGVTIATLTARGMDVAAGRSVVPGVKRPAPGAAA